MITNQIKLHIVQELAWLLQYFSFLDHRASQTPAVVYFFDKFLILKGGEAPLKQSKW